MLNQPEFIMLVGLPGSGKSTYAENHKNSNCVHISSDNIREQLYGDANIQENSNQVFYLMKQQAIEALQLGQDVIYDATNISRKFRVETLKSLPSYAIKKCVIVWADIDTCLTQNNSRDRTVPKAVIDRMLRSFQAPFYDEGWHNIEIEVPTSFDSHTYSDKCIEAMKISQDNPHHTLSIIEHCFETRHILETELNVTDAEILSAGSFHDVGKPVTKSFINSRGEETSTAHYYGHQGAGAWMSYGLFYNVYISWLISTHMEPFNNSKYYQKLPAFLKEPIDLIHKADLGAH